MGLGVKVAQPQISPSVPPFVALNCCDVSPWVIGSAEFNERPTPLRLARVRESNRGFFAKLRDTPSIERRGEIFHEYLDVIFGLHHWTEHGGSARRSLRNSYLRFLQGWMVDSNGPAGAVLKSWTRSRFGLDPTFHRKVLRQGEIDEDPTFAFDRMKGMAATNAIYLQLDLLYEYCQYELARRWPGKSIGSCFVARMTLRNTW